MNVRGALWLCLTQQVALSLAVADLEGMEDQGWAVTAESPSCCNTLALDTFKNVWRRAAACNCHTLLVCCKLVVIQVLSVISISRMKCMGQGYLGMHCYYQSPFTMALKVLLGFDWVNWSAHGSLEQGGLTCIG